MYLAVCLSTRLTWASGMMYRAVCLKLRNERLRMQQDSVRGRAAHYRGDVRIVTPGQDARVFEYLGEHVGIAEPGDF